MRFTWLGIVVLAVLLLFMWIGYKRGFIKEIVSFFFLFLSLSLAWMINPYINNFLTEKTPIYSTIQETCSSFVHEQSAQAGTSGSFIDELKVPDIMKENLQKNNNEKTYAELSADTLTEYVSGYLARTVINGLSYVLSYILSAILIRLIVCVLNLVAGLPVLRTANKLTGGAVGFLKGLVFVWIAFLILTVLCSTETGKTALELIEKDSLLSILYQYDPLVRIFAKIF